MTTPHGHARLMLARRTAFDLLDAWGCPNADQRATELVDALQAAGWGPPREITHGPGRGSSSTDAARTAAKEHLANRLDELRAARMSSTGGQRVSQRATLPESDFPGSPTP